MLGIADTVVRPGSSLRRSGISPCTGCSSWKRRHAMVRARMGAMTARLSTSSLSTRAALPAAAAIASSSSLPTATRAAALVAAAGGLVGQPHPFGSAALIASKPSAGRPSTHGSFSVTGCALPPIVVPSQFRNAIDSKWLDVACYLRCGFFHRLRSRERRVGFDLGDKFLDRVLECRPLRIRSCRRRRILDVRRCHGQCNRALGAVEQGSDLTPYRDVGGSDAQVSRLRQRIDRTGREAGGLGARRWGVALDCQHQCELEMRRELGRDHARDWCVIGLGEAHPDQLIEIERSA